MKEGLGSLNLLFPFAQGILHTGKGSITMSPYHTDRSLMSTVAVSGLLGTLVSALDVSNTLLKANHFMLYHLSLVIETRRRRRRRRKVVDGLRQRAIP